MTSASNVFDDVPSPAPVSVLFVGGDEWRSAVFPDTDDVLVTGASRGRDALQWLDTQPGRIDCVVCTASLPDMNAISLLEAARASHADVPFVLLAAGGDEALASRAIGAGVSDYVPIGTPPAPEDRELIRDSIRDAVVDYRDVRTRTRRARQFEALFEDPETFTWVLDADGTVRRGSRPSLDADDRPSRVGQKFWELDLWDRAGTGSDAVRDAVWDVRGGEVARFESVIDDGTETGVTLDVTIRPVTDEVGTTVSLVVEGVDVTDRMELEQELRESEELHRVTLNNMTDTVLVTDDDGAFTYICPNVHFIFGYSVEEIREMGSIHELLGEDLYDPAELDESGVLTNIECTATDRAGNEHTLLVNVRQVSIQGGTTLVSCRDITKRKERERALTALHDTSRELLYAETGQEIARRVAEDATTILDLPACAVYLFDSEANALRPVATSEGFTSMSGPQSSVSPEERGIVSGTFVEQRAATYEDVHGSDQLRNPATEIRSAFVAPLGDHGVLVVGGPVVGAFDAVTEEVADLLAATAEAALDRVEREGELRERDRELQQQNRQLTRLNRTNTIIREIDQSLVRATSRSEIESAVCERLTASDRFEFAWIGERDPDAGRVDPAAWAGSDSGYLDAIDLDSDSAGADPGVRTAESGDPTVVVNVGEDLRAGSWRKAALSRGYQSVASVPIAYDDYFFGVLTVYASRPDAFDGMARSVLSELGETIASAMRAAERREALLSESVTELEYRVTDGAYVLYSIATEADCSLEVKGGVSETDEGSRAVVTVEGAPVERVVEAAELTVSVVEARPIVSDENGGVVQVTLDAPVLATRLADVGASLESVRATPDGANVTIDVPRSVEVHDVDELVTELFPESELIAQRERDESVMTRRQFKAEFLETVTDRQLEVVQTAYYSGYFESPRQCSGQHVAETLGISPSAFYDHTRKVQRKLFATLLTSEERL